MFYYRGRTYAQGKWVGYMRGLLNVSNNVLEKLLASKGLEFAFKFSVQ